MLRIEHLTKHYPGSNKGVTDLSLHIEPGDLYAFIGHNGAGKTTTLKAIAGIHEFSQGRILINGIDIQEDSLAARRQIAYIPDDPDLYGYLTGIQYLNFVADIFSLSGEQRTQSIQKYADLFELTEALGDLIGTFSHGMKQKLAMISAFIHAPKLLILDEPFVGLDPKAAIVVKNEMHALCERGGAVFFSTHVLDVAERLCNKLAIIKEGSLVYCGTMSDALKDGQTLESIFMEVAVDA